MRVSPCVNDEKSLTIAFKTFYPYQTMKKQGILPKRINSFIGLRQRLPVMQIVFRITHKI
jgi:hypothetical protein